jgi:hypothetical protein
MFLLGASRMAPKNKRRVVIGENDRGVRHGRFPQQHSDETLGPVKANYPNKSGRIIVPTHDRRHMTKIRLGVLDTSTAFSRARRESLPVDPDAEFEQSAASRKAAEEALAELAQEEVREKDVNGAKEKKRVTTKVTKAKPKAKAKKKPVTKPKAKAKAKAPVKRKPVKRKVTK